MDENLLLTFAALLFIVTHLGISSSPLRGILVNIAGENGYLGIYSIISLAALVWFIQLHDNIVPTVFLWQEGAATNAIPFVFMPFVVIFVASGLLAKNPTAVKMEAALGQEVTGILRVTRHPVQWGIFIWATTHMIANGDVPSLIFFGCFAIVSGAGTVLLDRKCARREGEKWAPFVAKTSNVPFMAIIAGRNRFAPGEIGWLSVVVSVVLFVLLAMFHGFYTGVALFGS
ncbi:MAG: NnrU family protein [Pseudomonadales bacterium]|jgi:uncharacterized membrane protein|nr:NnrU family protein [Pseudomonadales bacterium]MDP7359461.1 NnrU family protein [Pseudomonadales bacterium]MDP7595450.1 NnrU family protein [Pseudomonadales bacterium]HJN49683.1 NnrU family protein [Pseudomonadales bacterium]|tara:strand:+ start:201 stop:890 length:690 start_codon:yes stop_codon:yes gene_type:complete